jgi:hypothetical protein
MAQQYTVIETQAQNDGASACITTTHDTRAEAEQKYHQVLAAAAVSEVDYHSCTILDFQGQQVANQVYVHYQEETPDAK